MRLVPVLLLLAGLTAPTAAQPGWASGEPIVEARLVADVQQVALGEDFRIGVHQIMPEGWHTYWRNPGDNGLPIELKWSVPAGVEIGEISWPAPVELPLGEDIMDYGYRDEIVLPMPVRLAGDFAGDSLTLAADATWLVCEEICIPEERRLELTLPVGETAVRDEEGYWHIEAALERVPERADDIEAGISVASGRVVLDLSGGDFSDPAIAWRDLKFFPYETGLIRHAGMRDVRPDEDHVLLLMEPGYRTGDTIEEPHGGVLVYEVEQDGRWQRRTAEIVAAPSTREIALQAGLAADGGGSGVSPNLAWLFLLAFGGGLILNLMPCVFPILSIKVLKLVQAAHGGNGQVQRQGLAFLVGVLGSFVGLAALLVGLREFGLPVGWGFQLQVPVVVAALAVLLFAIGLNLMGAFEVGGRLMGVGAGLADKPGLRGAFFTGVLAVIVAAPCVGPLAAGALGLALTQPAPVVLLIAAALGLGLAAPFVLFSFAPGLLKFLPRPGAWMVTFRQFLAFPMFAAALWLVWVLSIQSGPAGVLFVGIAMVSLAFAIWAFERSSLVWKAVAAVALLTVAVSTVWVARLPAAGSTQTAEAGHETWSRARVAELRAEGRAVFVDVTAAWCVTCQVNKIRVLSDARVQEAFERFGVVQMRADWTNRDETIAELIYEHGQAGVPLYLLYPAGGGAARVLPTVLTKDGLIAALDNATRRRE